MKTGNDGWDLERGQALEMRESEARDASRRGSAARYWPMRLLSAAAILGALAAMPAQAAGPAPVNLRTAGDFVILSKAGISTTGVTAITGGIGVSPISASAITGFGLSLVPPGRYSTSTLVTGKVYAANYAVPTPDKMTTAVGDLETAYTDAAGRTSPDFTELLLRRHHG